MFCDLLRGAGLLVAIVALVGVFSLIDFSALWTVFHRIAFRNDLWLLDPTRDYLIMLFPEPAWYAYTLRMVVGVGGVTLLAGLAGVVLAWAGRPARS